MMLPVDRDPDHLATQSPPEASPSRGVIHSIFRRHLPLETETAFFILVNLLDYFVTYSLLHLGGFREANPVANWFLEGWGPVKGLLYYKLAMVTLVCVITQIVYTKRPRTARALLIIGSLVVLYVVVHGARLLYGDIQSTEIFNL